MSASPGKIKVESVRPPWMIAAGILAGGVVLAGAVTSVGSLVSLEGRWQVAVLGGVGLALLSADAWAVAQNRLYPIAFRRQAVQTLIFRWRKMTRVLFAWGFDAGFSVGTYRVTSGLWLLMIGTIIGLVPTVALITSSAVFALGLMLSVNWIWRGDVELRLQKFGDLRRHAQALYLVAATLWVVTTVAYRGP